MHNHDLILVRLESTTTVLTCPFKCHLQSLMSSKDVQSIYMLQPLAASEGYKSCASKKLYMAAAAAPTSNSETNSRGEWLWPPRHLTNIIAICRNHYVCSKQTPLEALPIQQKSRVMTKRDCFPELALQRSVPTLDVKVMLGAYQ